VLAALNNQTFPIYRNKAARFEEVTYASGCGSSARSMAGYGPAFMTLITMVERSVHARGACGVRSEARYGYRAATRYFAIFGASGQWQALTAEAAWTRLPQPGIEVWRLEILTETARGCGRHGARQRTRRFDESNRRRRPLAGCCAGGHQEQS